MDDDDDPLFALMRRFIKLGEMLPSDEELLEDKDAVHRAVLIIAEMNKIDREVKSGRYNERPNRDLP
jgi:hypothetical protein